jgi:hypothetical protein
VSKTTEPIHKFIGNDEMGAARCRYYCPHCNMEFFRKTPCVSHAADCPKSRDRLNRQLRKIEIERFLSDAKGETECFEKIIAYEEQGIHAVCTPAADGTCAISSVRKKIRREGEA